MEKNPAQDNKQNERNKIMALQEIIKARKKLILDDAKVHNTKLEEKIKELEQRAMTMENHIYYDKIRLSKIENEIMEIREELITISK